MPFPPDLGADPDAANPAFLATFEAYLAASSPLRDVPSAIVAFPGVAADAEVLVAGSRTSAPEVLARAGMFLGGFLGFVGGADGPLPDPPVPDYGPIGSPATGAAGKPFPPRSGPIPMPATPRSSPPFRATWPRGATPGPCSHASTAPSTSRIRNQAPSAGTRAAISAHPSRSSTASFSYSPEKPSRHSRPPACRGWLSDPSSSCPASPTRSRWRPSPSSA